MKEVRNSRNEEKKDGKKGGWEERNDGRNIKEKRKIWGKEKKKRVKTGEGSRQKKLVEKREKNLRVGRKEGRIDIREAREIRRRNRRQKNKKGKRWWDRKGGYVKRKGRGGEENERKGRKGKRNDGRGE